MLKKTIILLIGLLFISQLVVHAGCPDCNCLLCDNIKNIKLLNKDGIEYYTVSNGINIIIIRNKCNTFDIEPYVAEGLEENSNIFYNQKVVLSVNGGYFDPFNAKTISYIIKNSEIIADPRTNENLTTNPLLQEHLEKIFNRSEFRILQKGNKIKYDIAKHNDLPDENWKIKHSIQAGPMLLPYFSAEEEYFLKLDDNKVVRDSISVMKKAARTAIGIKNGDIYLIIATVKNPITLQELITICTKLKLEKAVNFDGGGSTSFDSKFLHIVSEKNEKARKLKSFLIVK